MSRRLGVEDRGWSCTGWILGAWTIKRSDDAVCSLHRVQGDEARRFLGSTKKTRSTISPGLASKLVATVLVVWP
jgi:hypothetical protein